MTSTQDRLSRFRELLRTEDSKTLRGECGNLLAAGIEFEDIARVVWEHVSEKSVADPSWLPAASCVNHADQFAQVELQLPADKHKMVLFGESRPEFRRSELPPRLTGSLEELQLRLREVSASNDWLLTERCLLGIVYQSDVETTFQSVFAQLLRPEYLGTRSGAWWTELRLVTMRCAVEQWRRYGDEAISAFLCRNGARQCARQVGTPDEKTTGRDAIAD